MHKIAIILEAEKEYLLKTNEPTDNKKLEKYIKIDDYLFEIGLRKGLIEKTEDGYIFVGDYEELLAFRSQGRVKSFDWLE